MISMGPIGHSIWPNYRKPMKILFCLRLARAAASASRVTEFQLRLSAEFRTSARASCGPWQSPTPL